jgi:CheY-like chemotaxis protein
LSRVALVDYLQEMGYDAVAAEDGQVALQLQRRNPFDVCIVDVRMPGIDGVETVKMLSRLASDTQFIICTGSPQFTLTSPLRELGLERRHIIYKPVVDMEIFVKLIKQLSSSSRIER